MRTAKVSNAISILVILASVLSVSRAAAKPKTALINRLFANYNPDIAPQLQYNSFIVVDMKVLDVFPTFDEHHRTLEITWQLVMNWTDLRMKWNPEDHGGVKYVTDDDNLKPLWTPTLSTLHSIRYHECNEVKVYSDGQIRCFSNLVSDAQFCNLEVDLPNAYRCAAIYPFYFFSDFRCPNETTGCFDLGKATSDPVWKYATLSNYTKSDISMGYNTFWRYDYRVIRIRPRPVLKFLHVSTVVVGCVVLLQWLVMLNYRERAFLNIALMCASFTILSMLHSIPTIENGGGRKLLRLSSSVVILNSVAMVVHVVSINLPPHLLSAAAGRLSPTPTRCLPTIMKLPGGEADRWILLNVTIDRVFFALSLITFVVLCAL